MVDVDFPSYADSGEVWATLPLTHQIVSQHEASAPIDRAFESGPAIAQTSTEDEPGSPNSVWPTWAALSR